MKVAVMQPYFLPYIGYWQLMNLVDQFVVYDNVQFTKKGWIKRNRILAGGEATYITLPIKKDSDFLDIQQRCLADSWPRESRRLLRKVANAYRNAPYYDEVWSLVEQIFLNDTRNLFEFLFESILLLRGMLGITTPVVVASSIPVPPGLSGQSKVLSLSKALHATDYINPFGGRSLYDVEQFSKAGIRLHIHQTNDHRYTQFENEFVPFLSILDVLMFNSAEEIKNLIVNEYTLSRLPG